MVAKEVASVAGGGSSPRYTLDVARLEQALGAPLGPVLAELSRLACRISPFAPWAAFERLQMHLVYFDADASALSLPQYEHAPEGALIFLETGVDLNCAGFLDDGSGRPLDERQIVLRTTAEAQRVARPRGAASLSSMTRDWFTCEVRDTHRRDRGPSSRSYASCGEERLCASARLVARNSKDAPRAD